MKATSLIANEVSKVLSENDTYQSYRDSWRYLLESYIGGDEYRESGHLVRYINETDGEYQARLRSTPLDNHCNSIVSIYTSFLFRETPTRNLGPIVDNVFYEDFMKDCDYEGRTLDHFMKDLSNWVSVFGHAWMMVIKPNVGAVTQADELAAGVRPYLTMLTPLVVIDWEWTRQANGKYELSYFKYIEDINGDVYTVKEWTKELVKTSVVDSIRRDYIGTVTIEENQLGTIPAVICYNKRSSVRGIGISDIRDIADQQRFIYNAKSEVDQSIRMNTHPSLVKTPNTQAGIGAGSIIHLDESMDPGLKPYLLEFNGASVESIYTAIEQCESMIDKIANTGAIRSTDAKRQSGVAQEQEFQLLNARLSDKANSIELAEEQMWKIWCQYQGLDWEGSIEYPDNFNIRDSINDLDFYLKASTASVNSETFRKELQKHIANLIIEDEIALEIAKAEIDESTMDINLEMPAQNISVTVQEEEDEEDEMEEEDEDEMEDEEDAGSI